MYLSLYLVAAIVVLVAGSFIYTLVARRYRRYHGKMVLTCPETDAAAVVELDARRAVLTEIVGGRTLRMCECTRWPARADCDQSCLKQIDPADPHASLIRARIARWFEGRSCVVCDRTMHNVEADMYAPALLTPDGRTVSVEDIAAEAIEATFETHLPVCWRCHAAEAFRQSRPELVVDSYPASA